MKNESNTPHILRPKELESLLVKEPNNLLLIDVREDYELEIASFPAEVLHLPLSKYESWANTLNSKNLDKKKVIVICHSGIRSFKFALWLIDNSLASNVWNLDGGIDAWSESVDPSIERY